MDPCSPYYHDRCPQAQCRSGGARVCEAARRASAVHAVPVRSISAAAIYPRALFEPGEIEALREVFGQYARSPTGSGPMETRRRCLCRVYERPWALWQGLAEGEKGKRRDELDFEEFVEICGDLKDVSIAPAVNKKIVQRRRIPVEKSGGGV